MLTGVSTVVMHMHWWVSVAVTMWCELCTDILCAWRYSIASTWQWFHWSHQWYSSSTARPRVRKHFSMGDDVEWPTAVGLH